MVSPDPQVEASWHELLTKGHRPLKVIQTIFKRLPSEPRCKLCFNPFGGIGGKLVGVAGFTPSPKNPNFCRKCCDGLPPGGAELDIAVLFADIRGSTGLGERMSSSEYAALLNRFYVAATRALLRHDAIIDKLIGDEVMALFIPGICGPQYRLRAVDAAISLLAAVGYSPSTIPWLPIGVGVHAGTAFVGNVGPGEMLDFTAVGDAVNTASRLQREAQAGEAVISDSVYVEVRERFPGLIQRELVLRGKEEHVMARVLSMAETETRQPN